ncbi:hypothetical protein AB0F88_00755 [Streptosporangium sp. NPDC023963]|uniref:hypothetical protein n=1 Tax=Streptosporangium sp. NPDC023963 TaxID=3155608 RepID=UPI0034257D67
MSPTRRLMALDLGTARTRSLTVCGPTIADRPSSIVRRSSTSGGRDVVQPIRHGMVADPDACLRLLRRLRAALRLPVSAAPQPQHATVRGLMRLCLQPALAAGLAPSAR